jgi:hypothetical protein
MKHFLKKTLLWKAGLGACIGLALVPVGLLLAKQETAADERSIQVLAAQSRLSPVLITGVFFGDQVGHQNVQCGLLDVSIGHAGPVVPFRASGNWLNHVSIRLMNRTDKVIVGAQLNVMFLDTGDCKHTSCAGALLQLGAIPSGVEKNGEKFGSGKPLDWRPNESINIHLSDFSEELKSQLENRMPMEDVHKIAINHDPFYFADGMRWGAGNNFAVPEPGQPGRFTPMDQNFFPGNKYLNWPPPRP